MVICCSSRFLFNFVKLIFNSSTQPPYWMPSTKVINWIILILCVINRLPPPCLQKFLFLSLFLCVFVSRLFAPLLISTEIEIEYWRIPHCCTMACRRYRHRAAQVSQLTVAGKEENVLQHMGRTAWAHLRLQRLKIVFHYLLRSTTRFMFYFSFIHLVCCLPAYLPSLLHSVSLKGAPWSHHGFGE